METTKGQERLTSQIGSPKTWADLSPKAQQDAQSRLRRIVEKQLYELTTTKDATKVIESYSRLARIAYEPEDKATASLLKQAKQKARAHMATLGLPWPPPRDWKEVLAIQAEQEKINKREKEKSEREEERLSIISSLGLSKKTSLKAARQAWEAAKKRKQGEEKTEASIRSDADQLLENKLKRLLIADLRRIGCYVYLRRWTLDSGERWFKVGITDSPSRREAEQNVLPVPAETLIEVKLPSRYHAEVAERTILEVLQAFRIRGANNRELFRLSEGKEQSLIAALRSLEKISAVNDSSRNYESQ